jgi:hypothetical protein
LSLLHLVSRALIFTSKPALSTTHLAHRPRPVLEYPPRSSTCRPWYGEIVGSLWEARNFDLLLSTSSPSPKVESRNSHRAFKASKHWRAQSPPGRWDTPRSSNEEILEDHQVSLPTAFSAVQTYTIKYSELWRLNA